MKERIKKRELYPRVIRTAETADDVMEIADRIANSVEKYIDDAEQFAAGIVRSANIEVILKPGGLVPQMDTVNRARLTVQVDQALDVLMYCRIARADLKSAETKDAVWKGIMLAQSLEQLHANRRWWEIVVARKTSDLNLRHDKSVTDDEIYKALDKYPTRQMQANAVGLTLRQLQRRIKNLNRD